MIEPSEAALEAAREQFCNTTAYWAPELLIPGSGPHIEKLVDDVVAAAYAVDSGRLLNAVRDE